MISVTLMNIPTHRAIPLKTSTKPVTELCRTCVKEKQSGKIIYAPGSFNARGQMNHYTIANKSIYTSLEYDVYGLPAFVKTGHSYPGSTNIQYLETNFDSATGNLNWRNI